MQRQNLKTEFVKKFKPGFLKVEFLAGDASFRKYERYHYNDHTCILMDAPPESEKPQEFVDIANILTTGNLTIPEIYAHDTKNGFILLEDFGNLQMTKFANSHKDKESQLYIDAIDVILELQKIKTNQLTEYRIQDYLNESITFLDYFIFLAKGQKVANNLREDFLISLEKSLIPVSRNNNVFVHRDFMADNILILDNYTGMKRLGIIDFQDAKLGSCAYDLVSLLEDARRDVSDEISAKCLQYFVRNNDVEDDFYNNYYSLGLQRNLKIMGYFARKLIRDNDENYLKFLPRVWDYLKNDLINLEDCEFKDLFYDNFFDISETQIDKLCHQLIQQ
jgi:aminoglycoside/choline kinase family phosphotransferase